jgi:hypothetical protein
VRHAKQQQATHRAKCTTAETHVAAALCASSGAAGAAFLWRAACLVARSTQRACRLRRCALQPDAAARTRRRGGREPSCTLTCRAPALARRTRHAHVTTWRSVYAQRTLIHATAASVARAPVYPFWRP